MDMKFLETRYDQGKAWVEKYMEGHHRYVPASLQAAHGDLLQWQWGEHGGEGSFV